MSEERIRVQIAHAYSKEKLRGWATPAGASEHEPAGYTVEWDDGLKDLEATRWHFEGDGWFNLERVEED